MLCLSLCALLFCFSSPVKAEDGNEIRFIIGQNSYFVNGTEKSIDVAPCIRDGRTYLPLRAAANAVGIMDSDINWNAETQTVSLKKDNTVLSFIVGSKEMRINQSTVNMDVPAEMIEGRVMLPIKWLAQALNCDTTWDSGTQTVKIKPLETLRRPGENWGLVFDLSGCEIKEKKVREDNRRYYMFAGNMSNGFVFTIFMDEENEVGDSKKARDFYWKQMQADTRVKRENVVMSESSDMAFIEYDVNVPGNPPISQKCYNASLAHGKVYINIHLSKINYNPDEKLFEEFLSKVKVVEPMS